MATKKDDVHLKIIVNGRPIPLKADPDSLLESLVLPALEKAKADTSEPGRWLFKDQAGNVLDKSATVGSFGFAMNAELFLSLEAGVVG